MLGTLRAVVSQPVAHPFSAHHCTVRVFSRKARWLYGLFEATEFLQTMPPSRFLLGDFARQRDCETETILKVVQLGRDRERFAVETLKVQEQPGKRLDESRVELVASQCPQQDFGGIAFRARLPTVRKPQIPESGESVFDPVFVGRGNTHGHRERQGGGREPQEPSYRTCDVGGNRAPATLHQGDILLADA